MIKEEIDNLWSENKGFQTRLRSWLKQIHAVEKKTAEVKKYFHQWSPLWAYVRAGGVGNKNGFCFSLRYSGQEVATLEIQGKEVFLKITEDQARPFKELNLSIGSYPWRSAEAAKFRKYFASNPTLELRFKEHEIESRIIREMLRRSRSKFGGTLSGIQPVTLSGFPLQFPVPFSASSGIPEATFGHIDILARRRSRRVCLSVWELKRPHQYKNSLREGYIYTATVLKMLRDPELGQEWYRVFGFSGKIPFSLRIECVIAVTPDQEEKLMKERTDYQLPQKIGNDFVDIFASYYDEKTLKMNFKRI